MAFRILLVDDNPIVLEALSLALERDGFEVDTQVVASIAAGTLAGASYDAVVSDFRMPERDGLWFLQQVAAALPNAFKVLISGDQSVDREELEARPEVDRFLRKPVDKAELLDTLRLARQQHAAM